MVEREKIVFWKKQIIYKRKCKRYQIFKNLEKKKSALGLLLDVG